MSYTLDEVFRKGKELALYDGELWDELSGAEKNGYYSHAEELLIARDEESER
jgi:hypothetical protein